MNFKMFMKTLRNATVTLLLVISFGTLTPAAGSATVRGRLDRRDSYGRSYPAAYVRVTLHNPQLGRSAPAVTGTDGMYYFYNIPAGGYYLEVWVYPDRPPYSYQISVPERAYVDIPPILIP
jgi:hypothetical protein